MAVKDDMSELVPTGKKTPYRAWSKNDLMMITLLAHGNSISDTAKCVKMSERTVRRRLQDPAFCALLREATQALIAQASGQVAANMGKAARVLSDLLDSKKERTRLQASRVVLGLGFKLYEQYELEQQLAELRAALQGQGLV